MITTVSRRLVVLFVLAIGPVGVIAPKGIVLLVGVTGVASLVQWARDRRPKLPLDRTFALILGAFALWALTSAIWAYTPVRALNLVARLAALTAAGAFLLFSVRRLDNGYRRAAENAFLFGMGLAVLFLAAGFGFAQVTDTSLWGTYYFDPLTTLNNGAVAVSLLGWPAFAVLWRRGQKKAARVVTVAVYLGLAFLSSGAALLAPVIGLAAFIVVWRFRRPGALALAALAAVSVLAAPQAVSIGASKPEVLGITESLPASARHRLDMWNFAVEKIDDKPLWGWGMDASRSIPQEKRRLSPNMEIMPLHPHNAFLQVRLELGIPGAIVFAALVGAFFASVVGRAKDRFDRAVMAGAGSSYLTVAALSYGIWQNWWLAFAWALAALTALAVHRPMLEE